MFLYTSCTLLSLTLCKHTHRHALTHPCLQCSSAEKKWEIGQNHPVWQLSSRSLWHNRTYYFPRFALPFPDFCISFCCSQFIVFCSFVCFFNLVSPWIWFPGLCSGCGDLPLHHPVWAPAESTAAQWNRTHLLAGLCTHTELCNKHAAIKIKSLPRNVNTKVVGCRILAPQASWNRK